MAKKPPVPHETDPLIRFSDAVDCFGSQSSLARALNVERGTVSGWKDEEFVPPLQAHRLLRMNPGYFKPRLDQSAA